MKNMTILPIIILLLSLVSAHSKYSYAMKQKQQDSKTKTKKENALETATFGAGCFWCVEAIFQELNGVKKVVSGYSGGETPNPSYKEVCTGSTGHAEVCQITYNPKEISFSELLEVFWQTHDPTTLNRQGADVGTQYRSAIFFHNEEQEALAKKYKEKLNASKVWKNPIVTEIVPFTIFYVAENYHQNYYDNNSKQPYCRNVITPKIEKFRKVFKHKIDQNGSLVK